MHTVKRIEIIASSQETDKILAVLDRLNVPGYTVIGNVTGKSPFGKVSSDFDLGASKLSNVYVICCCAPEELKPIVEAIAPILKKYGGVSYVSDAMEIKSIKCVASL